MKFVTIYYSHPLPMFHVGINKQIHGIFGQSVSFHISRFSMEAFEANLSGFKCTCLSQTADKWIKRMLALNVDLRAFITTKFDPGTWCSVQMVIAPITSVKRCLTLF